MKDLIVELIPHAPHLGLYVNPDIPAEKVENAVRDYARSIHPTEVIALYDATLIGNAKDGAVFTIDRFVFQNNDLQPAQEIRYIDLVQVRDKRRFLGGRKVEIEVNRGRATITLTLDFSGKADAATYVARFLNEAMLRGAAEEMDQNRRSQKPETDIVAVREALERLKMNGQLSSDDYDRLMSVLTM